MLKKRADPNKMNAKGKTVLDLVQLSQSPALVKLLGQIWVSKLGVSGGVLRGQFCADIFSLLFFKAFSTFLDDHNVTMEIKPIPRAEKRG